MSEGERIAFRMLLRPGQRDIYRARHDAIWPGLAALLREAGISDDSIFLHRPSGGLFAVLRRAPGHGMARLGEHEVKRRWWAFMADITATGKDGAPVVEPLEPMFYLA